MIINSDTKVGALLKHNPDALEVIISLSPKFSKLRNPLLRKVIAGRTSIASASIIGGCTVNNFFDKLKPLGFEIDYPYQSSKKDNSEQKERPAFLKNTAIEDIVELDVRPVMEKGEDPLKVILQKIRSLKTGQVLKIINSFEPTPLINLLGKQGFDSYVEKLKEDVINTYFFKKTNVAAKVNEAVSPASDWNEVVKRFNGNLETVDVRALPMPQPMHTILDALETLPANKALFVYHKRIPVFLLPELEQRQFNYRVKEISESEVHLLIFKD
jgi:uncharacterized protein (DUF2249 family)